MSGIVPPKRILLIGDYSNMHSQLGRTLSMMGHDVTVMSAGSGFQDTSRNIDISRREGRLGGLVLAWRCYGPLHNAMRGYDVVALQNPHFLHLKPSRLKYFFDRLKGENERVFLTCAGTDIPYLDMVLDANSPLKYSEWRINGKPSPYAIEHAERLRQWLTPEMRAYHDHVFDNIDGAVTALYEYHIAALRRLGESRVAYGGIPIDTDALTPYTLPENPSPVKFFLGRHRGRYSEKGTDILEYAVRDIQKRHPGLCTLDIIENRPYAEYISTMAGSHVVLDQIYGYSPATNALIAMARGLNVVSGGEQDFYNFIGEKEIHPIIKATQNRDALADTLAEVASNPGMIAERGRQSRQFVIKHNDHRIVAKRFLDFWTQ